jgi:hypothetical protein
VSHPIVANGDSNQPDAPKPDAVSAYAKPPPPQAPRERAFSNPFNLIVPITIAVILFSPRRTVELLRLPNHGRIPGLVQLAFGLSIAYVAAVSFTAFYVPEGSKSFLKVERIGGHGAAYVEALLTLFGGALLLIPIVMTLYIIGLLSCVFSLQKISFMNVLCAVAGQLYMMVLIALLSIPLLRLSEVLALDNPLSKGIPSLILTPSITLPLVFGGLILNPESNGRHTRRVFYIFPQLVAASSPFLSSLMRW